MNVHTDRLHEAQRFAQGFDVILVQDRRRERARPKILAVFIFEQPKHRVASADALVDRVRAMEVARIMVVVVTMLVETTVWIYNRL